MCTRKNNKSEKAKLILHLALSFTHLQNTYERTWPETGTHLATVKIKHSKPKKKMLHDGWNLTIKSIYFVLKSFISDLRVYSCPFELNTYAHTHPPTHTSVMASKSPSMCTVSIHLSTRTLSPAPLLVFSYFIIIVLLVPLRPSLSDTRSNRLSNTPNNVHHLKL